MSGESQMLTIHSVAVGNIRQVTDEIYVLI